MQGRPVLHRVCFFPCLILALLGVAPAAEPRSVTIQLSGESTAGERLQFEVQGLSAGQLDQLRKHEQLSDLFSVYVLTDGTPSSTPLFGSRRVDSDRLTFEPRFELVPGVSYLARFSLDKLTGSGESTPLEARLRVPPAAPRPAGHVTQIYPSARVLPENTLKFYVHFSVPMSRGEAYRRIHLFKASGQQVEYPFLELGEELWDRSGMRFTLFFDPGRIKRGLKPREEVGPSLEEHTHYTLVIDQSWPDDRGRILAATFRKQFRVVAPDHGQPDPKKWSWQVPRQGALDPLTITFPEPLDHAMLQRVLVVLDSADNDVPGEVTVYKNETVWAFRPQQPWQAGGYYLSVDTALEDRAGNSIGRPFEVDMFRSVEKAVTPKLIKLPFEVK